MADLADQGIVTKVRTLKTGRTISSMLRAQPLAQVSATGSTLERWHSRVRSCRASNRPLLIANSSMPSKPSPNR